MWEEDKVALLEHTEHAGAVGVHGDAPGVNWKDHHVSVVTRALMKCSKVSSADPVAMTKWSGPWWVQKGVGVGAAGGGHGRSSPGGSEN